ncbi:hypothetical protein J6590_003231 [Homalodisca vitripennis]|nr:hypothetical protein J6590_003231 [Homalodisca vitripennis]
MANRCSGLDRSIICFKCGDQDHKAESCEGRTGETFRRSGGVSAYETISRGCYVLKRLPVWDSISPTRAAFPPFVMQGVERQSQTFSSHMKGSPTGLPTGTPVRTIRQRSPGHSFKVPFRRGESGRQFCFFASTLECQSFGQKLI